MARPTIDQVRGIGNVTQLFRWNLILAQFPAGLAAPPQSEQLNLRCESSTIPKMTGTDTEVNIRGHKVRQPGLYQYNGNIQLTFVETVDNTIHNFLKAWREICWQTRTGVQLPKNQVEAVILLQRLNQQDQAIWEYKLIGAFLQDYEPGGTLDSQGQDPLKPSLTLSYDLFEDSAL
jgi:hypothetical protein